MLSPRGNAQATTAAGSASRRAKNDAPVRRACGRHLLDVLLFFHDCEAVGISPHMRLRNRGTWHSLVVWFLVVCLVCVRCIRTYSV